MDHTVRKICIARTGTSVLEVCMCYYINGGKFESEFLDRIFFGGVHNFQTKYKRLALTLNIMVYNCITDCLSAVFLFFFCNI